MSAVVNNMGRLWLAATCLIPAVRAEEPTPSSTDQKAWLSRRREELQTYTLSAEESGSNEPLVFHPEPLLSWSNPVRQATHGGVFLWTRSHRPQVIACVFSNPIGVGHEFSSLAETPLLVTRPDNPVWTPEGVIYQELPDAPSQAASRSLRVAQMRQLSDRFRLTIGNDKPEVLRKLAQPLYRYPESPTVDGAVFAFVQTTDPEALLVLEWSSEQGWRYAFARMTKTVVRAELGERLVWDLPFQGKADLTSSYRTYLQPHDPRN